MFEEQPLASPGSAKDIDKIMPQPPQHTLGKIVKKNSQSASKGTPSAAEEYFQLCGDNIKQIFFFNFFIFFCLLQLVFCYSRLNFKPKMLKNANFNETPCSQSLQPSQTYLET